MAGPVGASGKWAVDFVLGTILAVLSLPVILVLAVAVAISLRANPFFLHRRVGRDGTVFVLPKLRTLSPRTPQYTDKYQLDPERDTTRLTAALRRLHLDELPQLLLVPACVMSLVGPRPEMAYLYARMPERQGGQRVRYRPGCTGLWQVSVAYTRLIADAPEYDIFYAEYHTMRLDGWILWRTALSMIGIDRPVQLEDVPRWTYSRRAARAFPRGTVPQVEIDRRGGEVRPTPEWYARIQQATEDQPRATVLPGIGRRAEDVPATAEAGDAPGHAAAGGVLEPGAESA